MTKFTLITPLVFASPSVQLFSQHRFPYCLSAQLGYPRYFLFYVDGFFKKGKLQFIILSEKSMKRLPVYRILSSQSAYPLWCNWSFQAPKYIIPYPNLIGLVFFILNLNWLNYDAQFTTRTANNLTIDIRNTQLMIPDIRNKMS